MVTAQEDAELALPKNTLKYISMYRSNTPETGEAGCSSAEQQRRWEMEGARSKVLVLSLAKQTWAGERRMKGKAIYLWLKPTPSSLSIIIKV